MQTTITTDEILGAVDSTDVADMNTTSSTVETIVENTTAVDRLGNFQKTLPIMGKGMLGIFIVTAVIVLTVTILNKVTNIKKKDDNE